jgi:hypothetical protein
MTFPRCFFLFFICLFVCEGCGYLTQKYRSSLDIDIVLMSLVICIYPLTIFTRSDKFQYFSVDHLFFIFFLSPVLTLFNVYIPFVNVFGLCMSFRCRDVIYVGDTHALQTLRIYFLSSHSGANRQPRYSFYIHARMASVVHYSLVKARSYFSVNCVK